MAAYFVRLRKLKFAGSNPLSCKKSRKRTLKHVTRIITYLTLSGLKSFSLTIRQFDKDSLSDGHLDTFT